METITLLKKNKNKIFNILVIVLALMIASNISKRQNKAMEAVREQGNAETKKNTVLGGISKLEKKINAYQNLLSGKDSGSAINIIGSIAKDSGANIVSIKPELEQRQADYAKNPINLTIDAPDYHALADFISKIEGYQKIVYVFDYVDIKSDPLKERLTVYLRVSSVRYIE